MNKKAFLFPGQLHDGVVSHAAARRLDHMGFHYSFTYATQLQKWLHEGFVDFVEIFRGHGELTIGVREAACTASDGFDKYAMTYGRCWCLETPRDQEDCAWLLVYALRPKVVHLGTPCTKMSVVGSRKIDSATEAQNEFTWKVAMHQNAEGLGVSIENPKSSSLKYQPKFQETFGLVGASKPGWNYYTSDGCQLHVIYPGRDSPGTPLRFVFNGITMPISSSSRRQWSCPPSCSR